MLRSASRRRGAPLISPLRPGSSLYRRRLRAHPPAGDGAGQGDWRERPTGLARSVCAVAPHRGYFSLIFTRPAVSPRTIAVVEYIFGALLEAGIPDAEVPRAERLMSTFVLGYALSGVSGRISAGRLAPGARREQLAEEEIPAHRRLAAHLDVSVAWTCEFEADLADMLDMVARLGH